MKILALLVEQQASRFDEGSRAKFSCTYPGHTPLMSAVQAATMNGGRSDVLEWLMTHPPARALVNWEHRHRLHGTVADYTHDAELRERLKVLSGSTMSDKTWKFKKDSAMYGTVV
eukprot:CAMPEP_0177652344 /NCGR_PEP_ID=MMETSP0447-20121125/13070_1 /TAXON_ID=0 /ORGANISM="Stygamoeba regulata, Strain BSH-02190019" /LENGTH=114 /DNA_ID=CAMNT_0019155563 /DNA_START=343 /DNA_END=687 /DNA_ORIENTATION=-